MEIGLERELVSAAKNGDETAFRLLIQDEAPRVYRAVLAIVRSPEDAQEVVQDASLRAWRGLRKLRDEASWPSWYRQIAVRQAMDRASRKGRLREIDLDSLTNTGWDASGGDPSATWDEEVSMMSALGRLATTDRAILGLRFGADLEVPDVAAALGIPLGTAKSRLSRALDRLAEQLGAPDEV